MVVLITFVNAHESYERGVPQHFESAIDAADSGA
jgi:hypothetical protein